MAATPLGFLCRFQRAGRVKKQVTEGKVKYESFLAALLVTSTYISVGRNVSQSVLKGILGSGFW